ncbi:MAG: Lrp/AsnC family transcriptional regulator [Candidatus Thorarchaeota archaeon]|jgi:DNA-binding Lrp family transcriptional regulator
MDQLDRDLIRILQKDAKTPFTRIAEELRQPDTTIHFRAKRLKESNTVTRYCALVRPESLGYTVSAIFRIEIGGHILPKISKDRTHSFAEEIAANEQYLWVAVDEEPMVVHALTMGIDEEDLQKRAETLRKSPDVVKVTMTSVSAVVKGWELSGNPE